MKHSLITLSFAIALAACSGPTESKTDTSADAVAVQNGGVENIGGAPTGPIYTENEGETLALSGYDAVSYFNGDAPVEGRAEHIVRYQGYDYQFANAENAAKFKADPASFTPQYGGHCAWAIGANDALAPGDPTVYKIVDGKLYLNFNKAVAEKWEKDIPGFIEKGDVNYPKHDPSEHFKS